MLQFWFSYHLEQVLIKSNNSLQHYSGHSFRLDALPLSIKAFHHPPFKKWTAGHLYSVNSLVVIPGGIVLASHYFQLLLLAL